MITQLNIVECMCVSGQMLIGGNLLTHTYKVPHLIEMEIC